MNKLFFAILMSIAQLGFAGQLHEIDVTQCPADLHIYQGDTIRFINPATADKSAGVRSALFNSLSLVPGDHYDYTFGPSTFLEAPIILPYNCGNLYSPTYRLTDLSLLPKITISNAPIAIYPKQYLISSTQPFDIGIYIITAAIGGGKSYYLTAIKGLSITVDGTLFFEGNMNEYDDFLSHISNVSFGPILFSCGISISQPFHCPVGSEGYAVSTFRIPANTFRQGKHVIQAKVTMTTEKGDVYYEDRGEYIIFAPFGP